MADVGERMPISKFILANGPTHKALPSDGHPKHNRPVVQQPKTVKREEKRPSKIATKTRQEILLEEHKQLIEFDLQQLHINLISVGLADVTGNVLRIGAGWQFLKNIPFEI